MFLSYEEIKDRLESELKAMMRVKLLTILKYVLGWIALISSIIFPVYFGTTTGNEAILWLSAFAFFFGVIFSIISFFKTLGTYRMTFKNKVVLNMVKLLIETCQLPEVNPDDELKWGYRKLGRIDDFLVRKTGLFVQYDRLSGEDLIYGTLGLTDFYLSELNLFIDKKNRDRNNRLKKIYNGVVFVADFNKDFKGHTLLRDKHFTSIGHLRRYFRYWFQRIWSGKKLSAIKLESKEFNSYFKVRTSNEIEARYILSPNFMEQLINFRKRHRNPIDISFKRSLISIAIPNKRDYFEPNIFESMKRSQARRVYNDLVFFFNIIEEFDLNTRLWNKS
ncbi:DUF3137 domain-containing protein [Virgibacillus ndiopensis]|uniref:DUF3137 domain-containing protein n=1 Tax=Virgibacillus ndiopensis TaxID=2004408 RepID=UPI000C0768C4|nr:DUF3137 domain-containing protein [Virgibacillus ndiopensis]